MSLYKIYKQSVLYPGIILLMMTAIYSISVSLIDAKEMASREETMAEFMLTYMAAALLYGLLIAFLALTIFLSKSDRISRSRFYAALCWFLLPGLFIGAVIGKAINEYLTVNSIAELILAIVANLPYIIGMLHGFRKYRTLHADDALLKKRC